MSTDLAIVKKPKASESLALMIGMEPAAMLEVIRAQCFKGNATTEQVAAFVVVASEMGINPLLPGMLYAYPSGGGSIVPILGPDGFYKKLGEHPNVDSWEVQCFPEDVTQAPTHAVAKIWRKGNERPISYTALLSEWKVGSNPNWNTRPRHMLQMRALKHAARQVIHGLPYDEDDRIIMENEPVNVTPPAERADPGAMRRGKAGPSAATPAENVVDKKVPEKAVTPPPAETPKPVPAADAPPAEPAKPKPTPFVKGEKIQATSTVVACRYENFSGKHGAIVDVEGGFNGRLYDQTGGHVPEEGQPPEVLPCYQVGKTISFTASGAKSATLGLIALVNQVAEEEENDVP